MANMPGVLDPGVTAPLQRLPAIATHLFVTASIGAANTGLEVMTRNATTVSVAATSVVQTASTPRRITT